MSGTYKAIGINLKSSPMGESDRLLTIFTAERGLVRLIAPGARKHLSSLGGRSALFVVNSLFIAQGKSLDKLTQAETIESYPGLSRDLGRLTVAQYLAELVLCQAIDDQPQPDLFDALRSHLSRLEQVPSRAALLCLLHATYHFLAIAGIAPEVHHCCLSRVPIDPESQPTRRIGFSPAVGGVIYADAGQAGAGQTSAKPRPQKKSAGQPAAENLAEPSTKTMGSMAKVANSSGQYSSNIGGAIFQETAKPIPSIPLTPMDLHLLQQLPDPNFMTDLHQKFWLPPYDRSGRVLERMLRQYVQFHFDRPIRSASLLDACFPCH
jgi:DNA repair protein RecO (recombination protein O)